MVRICFVGFIGEDINTLDGRMWILGGVFIEDYYIIFDREYNRVGVAKAK